MRQEMHRNCTDTSVSSVQTGTMVRHETAGQGLFRPIPAQGGCGPDCLRIRRLGVRIPPGALCFETESGRPRDVGGVRLFSTNLQVSALSRGFSPILAAVLRGVRFS